MTWAPRTFRPEVTDAAGLFGPHAGSTDFTTALQNPVSPNVASPVSQPWTPSTFQPESVQQTQSPDFMQRQAQDYAGRIAKDQISRDAYNNGQQTAGSTALQMFGQGAGMISDTAGNLIGSGARSLYDYAAGDAKPQINAAAKDAGQYLKNSQVGQAVGGGLQEVGKGVQYLDKNYPVTMRDAGALANIAGVVPALKGGQEALNVGGELLSDAGQSIAKSGVNSAQANRAKEIFKVITPKETPTVAKDLGTRSTLKGINAVVTPQSNAFENKVIDTVSNLQDANGKPLIKASDPHVLTYEKLDNAVTQEAQQLKAHLAYADAANPAQAEISKATIMAQYKTALDPILNEPLLGKAGRARVGEALAKIDSMIPATGNTASDLLDIRKKFDKEIEKFKGEAALNPVRSNAFTEAGKAVRQTTNDIVAAKYPAAAVRDSLDKQFHIYNAMDAVESKIPSQAKTRLGRAYDKIPGKSPYAKGAISALGLGAVTTALPAVAGGLALYGAKKAITSPITRKAIGATVRGTGNALQKI